MNIQLFDNATVRVDAENLVCITDIYKIAVERGCGRLEWWCLDWNQPSIDFYLSLGAQAMDEWTVYRITGKTLLEMASNAVK